MLCPYHLALVLSVFAFATFALSLLLSLLYFQESKTLVSDIFVVATRFAPAKHFRKLAGHLAHSGGGGSSSNSPTVIISRLKS